jgi:uncharacterized damage-inducible protein DinB
MNPQTPPADPRYPIGRFHYAGPLTAQGLAEAIGQIAEAPSLLRVAVTGLSDTQLDTPYREGGWTVRQVVHHVPDSHMNSYVRLRLALTEDNPLIKPYDEAKWAELSDASRGPVEVSLALLDALHIRWASLLGSLDESAWTRTFRHPEMGAVTLDRAAALYAWHGRHHAAHITALRNRMGW